MLLRRLDFDGFHTDFFITDRTKHEVEKAGVDINKIGFDESTWYHAILFDMIDTDADGKPDAGFGKEFIVYFHGTITKWVDSQPEGISEEVPPIPPLATNCMQMIRGEDGLPKITVRYTVWAKNGAGPHQGKPNQGFKCEGIIQEKDQQNR